MNFIIIDDYKFTYIEKIIKNDRCYVWLKSILNTNPKSINKKDELDFMVYKSNSQGMWRYFTCVQYIGCPYKWEDYTTTTMIDFRLQTFLNKNLLNIKLSTKQLNDYDFESIEYEYLSDFMTKEHFTSVPEFDVIFYQFENPVSDIIDMNKCMNTDLYKKTQLTRKQNNKSDSESKCYIKYKEKFEEFKKLFTDEELKNYEYLLYDLLKKISIFISNNFSIPNNPIQEAVYDLKLFSFENAKLKSADIMVIYPFRYIEQNDRLNNKVNVLYPYSNDIIIYSVILLHNETKIKYKLYYMKYRIVSDNNTYYMPLLITPEITKISKYGMPYKFVRTGIYCNKPWDYIKQCFFTKNAKKTQQICRLSDNYGFIGKNYKIIWPINLPIITGLKTNIVSSNEQNNAISINQEKEETINQEKEETINQEKEETINQEKEETTKQKEEINIKETMKKNKLILFIKYN